MKNNIHVQSTQQSHTEIRRKDRRRGEGGEGRGGEEQRGGHKQALERRFSTLLLSYYPTMFFIVDKCTPFHCIRIVQHNIAVQEPEYSKLQVHRGILCLVFGHQIDNKTDPKHGIHSSSLICAPTQFSPNTDYTISRE